MLRFLQFLLYALTFKGCIFHLSIATPRRVLANVGFASGVDIFYKNGQPSKGCQNAFCAYIYAQNQQIALSEYAYIYLYIYAPNGACINLVFVLKGWRKRLRGRSLEQVGFRFFFGNL